MNRLYPRYLLTLKPEAPNPSIQHVMICRRGIVYDSRSELNAL